MKLWKATLGHSPRVEEAEVLRANNKSMWVYSEFWDREKRFARFTEYESYFDTKAEAVGHCRQHLDNELARAARQAAQCEEALNKFCTEYGVEQ